MFSEFGYRGTAATLFRSIWWLSCGSAGLFALARLAAAPNYGGGMDLAVGFFALAIICLALASAALAFFLCILLTAYPDVPFAIKRSAWVSTGIPWLALGLAKLI